MSLLDRSFRLARDSGGLGLSCTAEGLSLAGAPLLRKTVTGFAPRPARDISALLKAAYGPAAAGIADLGPGLLVVANALSYGDLGRAMIGALRMKLPELDWQAAARIAKAEDALAKANFNPAEPRDSHGRWTIGEPDGASNPVPPESSQEPRGIAHQLPPDLLIPAVYNGVFHDQAVASLKSTLEAQGKVVETEVRFEMADGSAAARVDLLVLDPHAGLIYGIEMKTGNNPRFTPSQLLVYPHMMMGESVTTPDSKAVRVGVLPDTILQPIPILLGYQRDETSVPELIELDPKKMSRYYRGK